MPTPYNIIQPLHDFPGRQYNVLVDGDTLYVPDGPAIKTGTHAYTLPYKKAPAGTTQRAYNWVIPYKCGSGDPLINVTLTAKSGSTTLGGPRMLVVHDVV